MAVHCISLILLLSIIPTENKFKGLPNGKPIHLGLLGCIGGPCEQTLNNRENFFNSRLEYDSVPASTLHVFYWNKYYFEWNSV